MFRPGCIGLKKHCTSIKMLIIISMVWNGIRHNRWNLRLFSFFVAQACKYTIKIRYTNKSIRLMIKSTFTVKLVELMSEKFSFASINNTHSTRFIKNTGNTVNGMNTHLTMNCRNFLFSCSFISSIPVKILKTLTKVCTSNPVQSHG